MYVVEGVGGKGMVEEMYVVSGGELMTEDVGVEVK